MKLVRYSEFVNDMMFEAKMVFAPTFQSILNRIKSPLAKLVLDTIGKEVDINQNYIDIVDGKDDTISYIQDSRVKPEHIPQIAVITDSGWTYTEFPELYKIVEIDQSTCHEFPNGTECEIVRLITNDEIKSVYPRFSNSGNRGVYQLAKDGRNTFVNAGGVELKIGFPKGIRSTEVKVGRFIRKILDVTGNKTTDKEIEDFVNQFKVEIAKRNDAFRDFELVSGRDIVKYYNEKCYVPEGGQLNGSCMRYERCATYFGIYELNTDVCQLLIMRDAKDSEKIRGRALVWKLSDGTIFMDRAYTTKDSDRDLFVEYAKHQKWKYKRNQSNSSQEPIFLNGEATNSHLEVIVKNINYGEYPYLDTLKFYVSGDSIVTGATSTGRLLTNNYRRYSGSHQALEDTEGGDGDCDYCGGSGHVECDECNGRGREDCYNCDGTGREDCDECGGSGTVEDSDGKQVECDECGGSGKQDCNNCDGRGTVECSYCDGSGERDCPDCG